MGEQTNDASALASGDTTAFVTVLYNTPKDAAAFEAYYAATHIPLVGAGAAEIGFSRAELARFSRNLDGSAAALQAGTATAGFKAVGEDLPKFADGGLTALVGHLTSKP